MSNAKIIMCLCLIASVFGGSFLFGTSLGHARAQSNLAIAAQVSDITINGADFSATIQMQYASNLTSVTQNVMPRIVVEYADYMSYAALPVQYSSEVLNVTQNVMARIVVEYADYMSFAAVPVQKTPYIPEFSSTMVVMLFMIGGLLAAIILKRRSQTG